MAKHNEYIVGAAVGSGIAARAAELGGADLLFAVSAGRIRNMGGPSIASMLPFHDATAMTLSFAVREVVSQVKIPVYLGVNCWSKTGLNPDWKREIIEAGFAGAINFPTAIHYTPAMRAMLDQAGLGVRAEIKLLGEIEAAGRPSFFYCRSGKQAAMAADQGISNIVFNFGWNVGGAKGHSSMISLEEAASVAHDVSRLVKRRNPGARFFLEGGPILSAEELSFVARGIMVDGYIGGSTIDKFPIEDSIANRIALYRQAPQTNIAEGRKAKSLLTQARDHGLVGRSDAFGGMLARLDYLASTNLPLELIAEPGIDIEAVISFLTSRMGRTHKLRCVTIETKAELPVTYIQAMIFGRRGGARKTLGLLEGNSADILVFRNLEQMPEPVRKQFFSLLDTGHYQPIGSRQKLQPVPRLVLVGSFPFLEAFGEAIPAEIRPTLVRIPPLRERFEDIEILLKFYMENLRGKGKSRSQIPPAILQILRAHDWAGNDLELKRLAEVLTAHDDTKPLTTNMMLSWLSPTAPSAKPSKPREQVPKQVLLQTLIRNGFRRGDTAKALGISRKTLYNRMKRFDLLE